MITLPLHRQTSRSKAQNLPRVNAGFIKHTPSQMEDFAVTCRLVRSVSHLISGSCSSPRAFGLGFLQTSPHDEALALLLAFGSASTWHGDLHPVSSVPRPAHTRLITRGCMPSRASGLLGVVLPAPAQTLSLDTFRVREVSGRPPLLRPHLRDHPPIA